jgi:hypothetical protein
VALANAGDPALTIPSASGALTLDGVPDEAIWNQRALLPLQAPPFGEPFPAGGTTGVLVQNGYCVSARAFRRADA